MKISEYVKKEFHNIKNRPPKERWDYFLEYYKWHAIIILLVLIVLIQSVVGIITHKEAVFSGVIINTRIGVDDEAFLQSFYDFAGIDAQKYEAAFYTDITITDGKSQNDLNAFQRIMAGIAVKDTDFIAGKADAFQQCAYNSTQIFIDLREFLDEETLTRLADKLYYIDSDVLKQLSVPPGTEIDYSAIKYPDPKKPETMHDPIPVGIDISDREAFQSAYYLPNSVVYLGVVANTTRPELVLKLIDFLWS